MTTMEALLERVEKADGPDAELDHDICWALGQEDFDCTEGAEQSSDVTASLDAAIALVERVLPGCQWTIEADACWLRILDNSPDGVTEFQGHYHRHEGSATAMSVCLALLRALIAQKGEGNG